MKGTPSATRLSGSEFAQAAEEAPAQPNWQVGFQADESTHGTRRQSTQPNQLSVRVGSACHMQVPSSKSTCHDQLINTTGRAQSISDQAHTGNSGMTERFSDFSFKIFTNP